jgi:hypothetical protein
MATYWYDRLTRFSNCSSVKSTFAAAADIATAAVAVARMDRLIRFIFDSSWLIVVSPQPGLIMRCNPAVPGFVRQVAA